MRCPVCRLDQVIVEIEGVELDTCIEGHGVWFDGDELRQLFEVAGVPEMLHDLEERLEELPPGRYEPRRRCPRCRRKMKHVEAPGPSEAVILDRCPAGDGLWFDRGELEQILRAELGEEDASLIKVREFLRGIAAPPEAPATEDSS